MIRVLTNAQMRAADAYTIEEKGVPSQTLMERAGLALANAAEGLINGQNVLCVCGGGNNGGDGFICARLLVSRGYNVDVVCIAKRFSNDCKIALDNYLATGGNVQEDFPKKAYHLVVDCLLGTGLKAALSQEYIEAINAINAYKNNGAKVLSADIPSGVNGDNGSVESVAVYADKTLCIGEYKAGVFLGDGIDFAGKVERADIGIQPHEKGYATLNDKEEVAKLLPKRNRNTHKGSFGRAAIVAGSEKYTGAAYLSSAACLRSGAGYTTLFIPKALIQYCIWKAPESLLSPLCDGANPVFDEKVFQQLCAYDAVAYGMGMGESEEVAKGASYLLENYTGKLILDADALNSIAKYVGDYKALKNAKCDVLITPHIKEFSRLSGKPVEEILKEGLYAPVAFSKENNVRVLLKNAATLITDGNAVFINVTGNSGQAKGGSGDVLSGLLAGLCAQGLSTLDAARVGGYIVGKSADIAAKTRGEYSLIASDIIDCLGNAFLSLQG